MYEVRIKRPALKDIARLPQDFPRLVSQQIDALAEVSRPHGVKKLRGDGGYRVRVGIYRILYDIDDVNQIVTVYRVKHRREVYR